MLIIFSSSKQNSNQFSCFDTTNVSHISIAILLHKENTLSKSSFSQDLGNY